VGPKLYWIEGPWPGCLAISGRSRGGRWFEDEARAWRNSGVNALVSLLTPEEERCLDLTKEAAATAANQLKFFSFPIPDRGVPSSESEFDALMSDLRDALKSGHNVAYCRQGIGLERAPHD
jgi:hypothetical protein